MYRGEKHWQAKGLKPHDYVTEKLEIAKDLFQRKYNDRQNVQFSANGLRKMIRPRTGDKNEIASHLRRMAVV